MFDMFGIVFLFIFIVCGIFIVIYFPLRAHRKRVRKIIDNIKQTKRTIYIS
jgi:preprotein translocase subunit YajC